MTKNVYLAVDLGASGGRVLAGSLDGRRLEIEEVHRFANSPVNVNGRLYWRTLELWFQSLVGLRKAAARFGSAVASVGVDAWGVDFGLLDRNHALLSPPVAYRDARTRGAIDLADAIVPRRQIFAETGVQFLELNTLYQLLAAQREGSPPLDRASRLLLMPDLFHWMLTGELANEQTVASTTQLLNPRTRDWSHTLIDRFGLPGELFGPIVAPGTTLGPLLPAIAEETGLRGVKVVLPGSHDTASAVLAVPAAAGTDDWCYISSGTWSLMGCETQEPVINDDAFRWNFTNEGGVAGTTRLLKNVTGLWLVQECQRSWSSRGENYDWQELTRRAEMAPPLVSLINPDDPRLLAPADMPQAIVRLCRESGQPAPESCGEFVRCALESLALRTRQTIDCLEQLRGMPVRRIHIVGGGVQNHLLCQWTADACGRPVLAGPVEATAIGNVMMQAIAAGEVGSVAEARELIRESVDATVYEPCNSDRWSDAAERFER